MGRRKGQKQNQKTLIFTHEVDENVEEEEGCEGARFFACYLLTSLCPRFKGHTYIGYTVNPRRRIRQHNGEIGSGAWRTKRKRPWEMVLCIYGFPTNIAALQFEWAWQHPLESLAVRKAAANFKSLSGLANKIKLAYTMLTLPAWQSLNLTVNLFSTKYQKYTSGCPALPQQMRAQVCSMDELPCYSMNVFVNDEQGDYDDDEDRDINQTFQGSTEEESIEATTGLRPSNLGSFEANVHQQINHRDDATVECWGCSAKTCVGLPSPIKGDQGQQSSIIDGSPRMSSSFSSSYNIEGRAENPRLVKELMTSESDPPLIPQSATICVADKNQPLIKTPGVLTHDVDEIIEIFTPSPCYRLNSCSKKRRPTKCPEIIDLTNSPMSV